LETLKTFSRHGGRKRKTRSVRASGKQTHSAKKRKRKTSFLQLKALLKINDLQNFETFVT